ncbi:N-acetyltransferase-like protein [Nemania sp. FL0916]|nr:N-acetyltransferase-like protein [Nemania sp. FL0916]
MPQKEVDARVATLIRNCIQTNQRGLFLLVGDESKDVIAKLYYVLQSLNIRSNKRVLWAYSKKLLGFTSHRAKREKKIQKEIKRGIREPNATDPFELFVSSSEIRYTYYKETDKILGNTYGMAILQDFEGITPNVLARTIETVQGGGLCILLLRGIKSLKQLYTLSMSVHSRFRTEAHQDVVARFNERFLLSLGRCQNCLVIDDELNVLPISGAKGITPLPPPDVNEPKTEAQKELDSIKDSLIETEVVGSLARLARTVDQAKAILTFIDAITEKTLRGVATLTAARGRGKSACLGIAIAAAVALGYSNIFVTSPSPENLKTLFEFVFQGFDALDYKDHADYHIVQSTNPDFQKAIVRVNITRTHRQTIQYIRPEDAYVLGQCELLVIDEAAAIPLPLVKKLIGSYLVFMASTVNGYEGTGRSLSLKLIKQLRDQSRAGAAVTDTETVDRSSGKSSKATDDHLSASRSLREITLEEPIRYAQGDAVEKWLNGLLVLEAPPIRKILNGPPDPQSCHLLKINRDTLFSFHPVAEKFLQQIVQLFVASHYKNTPDDLQLLSDAPSHELYVLCAPLEPNSNRLPEPLCVIQVALEGQISRQSVLNSLSRGSRPSGDLIPWLVSQQFQDEEFASFSGARIIRIATSPEFTSRGYGAKAISDLISFYEGKFASLSEDGLEDETNIVRVTDEELENGTLKDEISIRDIATLPPLFSKLSECRPSAIEYIGVSYGLTQSLHKFWRRNEFSPVYLRQTPNDLTGEHTCVMLRPLKSSDKTWLGSYANDFHHRFLSLLSYQFRSFDPTTALSISQTATSGARLDPSYSPPPFTKESLDQILTPFDVKRLVGYANNLLDYHVILDLMPRVAEPYFHGRINEIKLNDLQRAILLAVSFQRKDLDNIVTDFPTMSMSQALAMFTKIVKKFATHFEKLISGAIEASLPKDNIGVSVANASGMHDDEIVDMRFNPLEKSLADELEEGGDEAMKEIRQKQRELIDSLPLDQYEVEGDNPVWDEAEKQVRSAAKRGHANPVVSVKSSKTKRKVGPTAAEVYEEEFGEKPQKKAKKSKKGH